ncbi:MAG TPA: type II secretion system F family protein [Kiritimatiellia bacterium]|jgi:Flp pilus assembly protein TadB|nr:type II secretion system F family protein [Kiritimatiellia bacterium]HOR97176.1 type II secretion system F family protein [Kiritimatiellia bacterium]HPC49555.1 type II secretion system F family protein [Kiritimatiellia bacterium]HPK36694.1 type II secretion system F family protein [Kiritimatiellia bacterium]HPW74559.1 type II secretion system F family protein [Kiritimatiellia bacterium]
MDVIIIQMLTFLSVLFLVNGIQAVIRKENETLSNAKPLVFRVFHHEIGTIGRATGAWIDQTFPVQTRQIRNDLIAGAMPIESVEVRGLQGFAGAVLFAVAGLTTFILTLNWAYGLLAGIGFGLMGWYYPVAWVSRCARTRKDLMSKSMPYAIDLITVSMEAGQDFGAAVRNLVHDGPKGPLRDEFGVTLRQIELGKSRVEGLKAMADRVQLDEFRSLVTSVVQSSEMGASISATLKIQAEEIRRRRYQRAERQAARAPSLMLIPTALFILPAVFIIIATPIIIRAIESGVGEYFQSGGG